MAELLPFPSGSLERPPLPDVGARELALRIDSSWIVEAPAGSGKTGLLIQRFLKLLADESVTSPEQVLAITFTRKATAEMLERILTQLQTAADGTEPANDFDRETRGLALAALQRDRSLGWSLLERPSRLRIRTIDSVCSEIANSLPVLSGTGGHRDVVEEAGELYALAAHRTFQQLGGPDAALNQSLREVLLHRDGDLANCERLLASMLRLRDQWGALVPLGRRGLDDAYLDANILPKLERALENAICSALTKVTKTFPEHLLRELTLAAASMAHLDGYKGVHSPIALCANRNIPPGERSEDLDHWRALIHLLLTKDRGWRKAVSANIVKFELSKSEQANLKALIAEFHGRDDLLAALCKLDELPPAKYPQEQWLIAKQLFRILNHAMAELQLVFVERSECDHAEIALAAKTALRADTGPDDLEAALGLRLQHILVDEMQDTSSSQYELIQMLTAHFDGHSQTAFLVGDPKQSIYLFRQARVERFLHAMSLEQLGDVHLGLLRLTANFRSQAGLVNDFNNDFSRVFSTPPAQTNPGEVQFVSASAMRPRDGDSSGRVWHADVLPYVKPGEIPTDLKRHRQASALQVRQIIEHWRSRPLPENRAKPWEISVLVRSRSHLERIVATLQDSPAIPYRAVDIDPLKERLEVQDLFALTRALLHPADRTAWLAVLHAPWCGLGLAELHILTGADDPTFSGWTIHALIAERGDLLPADAITRLERIWPVFEAAAAMRQRAPFALIVERTWRSLGGDRYLDTSELANSQSFLRLLEELEQQQGHVSVPALETRLERLFAAPSLDPNAVELLTIHKAKGLEWDVVIVPALERTSGRSRGEFLSWIELDSVQRTDDDDAAHFVLAPIAGKGEGSAELNKWIAGLQKSRESAEDKRLLYVACTRAREELHLFAAPKLSSKNEIKPRSGTLLSAAWPAAEVAFVDLKYKTQAPAEPAISTDPLSQIADDPGLAIAANASENLPRRSSALFQRLPLSFDPAGLLTNPHPLPRGDRKESNTLHFERPQGSLAARAFGNAVHAFMELIVQKIATGISAADLNASIPRWSTRVAALLRAEGLPPAVSERLTQNVLRALINTLQDPHGLWLLSPHEGAATEFALTTWTQQRSDIRIDRLFRAAADPLVVGRSHLWIVDYKTTTHGAEGLDAFLAEERKKYSPQLEAYAAVLKPKEDEPIRLALYFPMLSKLIWWSPS
jgi:ATP-dependent helicase/nuclease subunit A